MAHFSITQWSCQCDHHLLAFSSYILNSSHPIIDADDRKEYMECTNMTKLVNNNILLDSM